MAQATWYDKYKLGRPVARQNAATTKKLFISNGRQNVADIYSTKQIKTVCQRQDKMLRQKIYHSMIGQMRLTK